METVETQFIGETMDETISQLWRDQYGTEPPAWLIPKTIQDA